jgi:hypothetical protein
MRIASTPAAAEKANTGSLRRTCEQERSAISAEEVTREGEIALGDADMLPMCRYLPVLIGHFDIALETLCKTFGSQKT